MRKMCIVTFDTSLVRAASAEGVGEGEEHWCWLPGVDRMPVASTNLSRLVFDISPGQRFTLMAFLEVLVQSVDGYVTPRPYRAFTRSSTDKRVLVDLTVENPQVDLSDLLAEIPVRLKSFAESRGGDDVGPILVGSVELYESHPTQ
jgi:hypothetical protein